MGSRVDLRGVSGIRISLSVDCRNGFLAGQWSGLFGGWGRLSGRGLAATSHFISPEGNRPGG